MTSSSPPIVGQIPPTPFRKNYGGSSDEKRSPLSAASPRSSKSLESSTSSNSTGRTYSNPPTFQFLTSGRHSVPQRVQSGGNLNVGGAGSAAGADSDVAQRDHSGSTCSSSSVYPNTTEEPQTEVSGEGSTTTTTLTSESDLGREEDDPTPRNPSEEGDAAHDQVASDVGSEDQHREKNQDQRMIMNTDTLIVGREEIYKGIWKQGQPIPSKTKIVLPVGCKRQKNPCLHLRIIPCENEHSRHLNIEGELLIPRGCSRYKWLVEYCRCSAIVTTEVFDPGNSDTELSSVVREFNIQHSELNIDHITRIKLEEVLDHELVLYNSNITEYAFKATVQLVEHQVVHHSVPFVCKNFECEGLEIEDLIDVVPTDN